LADTTHIGGGDPVPIVAGDGQQTPEAGVVRVVALHRPVQVLLGGHCKGGT